MGFCRSFQLTKRLQAMEMLLRMVILLKGEIRYGNASLYDAFTGTAARLSGEYQTFLRDAASEMKENKGQPFVEIFKSCARRHFKDTGLSGEDLEKLEDLGGRLGYLDLTMQMKQLELYEKDLEDTLCLLRKELPEKKKVCSSLGILLGILAAVLVW